MSDVVHCVECVAVVFYSLFVCLFFQIELEVTMSRKAPGKAKEKTKANVKAKEDDERCVCMFCYCSDIEFCPPRRTFNVLGKIVNHLPK